MQKTKQHQEELYLLDLFTGSGYPSPKKYGVSQETEEVFERIKEKGLIRHKGGGKYVITVKGQEVLVRG